MGLRIPGYSTDEIRAARKWQPEGEYAENVKKISKLNKRSIVPELPVQLHYIHKNLFTWVNYNFRFEKQFWNFLLMNQDILQVDFH